MYVCMYVISFFVLISVLVHSDCLPRKSERHVDWRQSLHLDANSLQQILSKHEQMQSFRGPPFGQKKNPSTPQLFLVSSKLIFCLEWSIDCFQDIRLLSNIRHEKSLFWTTVWWIKYGYTELSAVLVLTWYKQAVEGGGKALIDATSVL